jgi:hypothetical protein
MHKHINIENNTLNFRLFFPVSHESIGSDRTLILLQQRPGLHRHWQHLVLPHLCRSAASSSTPTLTQPLRLQITSIPARYASGPYSLSTSAAIVITRSFNGSIPTLINFDTL